MLLVKHTVVELVLLMAIGSAVALSVNGVRAKGQIKPTHNYFPKLSAMVRPTPAAIVSQASADGESGSVPANGGTRESEKRPIVHGYRAITLDEAYEWFSSPEAEAGLYVFVDARNDDAYRQGRIPGAIQFDHYRLTDFLDRVVPQLEGRERVIVYCNGGDCEDSGFVCKDLEDAGIPYDALYLFAGGWKEWTSYGFPVEGGNPES